ncbi:glutamine-hydrolyzing GMP synthase [Eubacteriales bacterium OttesenSCG-928-N13]|nr:glutamine-hydrolyzing GMP synthase [Eubacteriales bacterium OttesenSCG-928-N13]
MQNKQKITILDFGGQYNQLIARRVREMGVYCEILPYTKPMSEWKDASLKGVILTGGPNSVYADGAPRLGSELFEMGVPVLGICYGMHLINFLSGSQVVSAEVSEYGRTELNVDSGVLFEGVSNPTSVFMSHTDYIPSAPAGFTVNAYTESCPVAAFSDESKGMYGVQFHPEVNHTLEGRTILKNFVFNICQCDAGYKLEDQIEKMIADVRAQVGDGKVVAALSGGVDSSVASVIADRALSKGQLTCVFVDHGMMRYKEAEQVMQTYHENLGLNIIHVNAEDRFLDALKGVTEPEQKRKIIGETFVRVFEEEARKIDAQFLLQGTIYPDIIESGINGSATIKSHHNVGGMPKESMFQQEQLVEPLKYLFKDEVRYAGESLGIPHDMLWRQPFPGPGLAVRCIGELRKERLDLLRLCDWIYRDEIAKAGLSESIWQYFAVLTGVKTVGVMGDDRTYADCIALRAVITEDAMTAEVAEIPYPVLNRIVLRIIGECPGVNRVVYDITSKPPGTIEWE